MVLGVKKRKSRNAKESLSIITGADLRLNNVVRISLLFVNYVHDKIIISMHFRALRAKKQ